MLPHVSKETGAPKTLQQLTDYMLDYVGSVNISAENSKSAYYNAKNKTMHFYTSGDDFGNYLFTFGNYLLTLGNSFFVTWVILRFVKFSSKVTE